MIPPVANIHTRYFKNVNWPAYHLSQPAWSKSSKSQYIKKIYNVCIRNETADLQGIHRYSFSQSSIAVVNSI